MGSKLNRDDYLSMTEEGGSPSGPLPPSPEDIPLRHFIVLRDSDDSYEQFDIWAHDVGLLGGGQVLRFTQFYTDVLVYGAIRERIVRCFNGWSDFWEEPAAASFPEVSGGMQ